jgi:hypothetical protein
MIEPKLFIVGGFQASSVTECLDDKGHSLITPGPMSQGFFSGQRQLFMTLPVTLRVVPGMGTKIASLKGELSFNVRVKHEVVDIDNIQSVHDLTRSAGGNTITIRQLVSEGNQYQLHILASTTYRMPGWELFQNPTSSVNLLDDKGQPLQQIGFSQNRDEYTLMFIVNGVAGPPKTLRWDVTTQTRQMTVPFELDDIDLPHAPPEGAQ